MPESWPKLNFDAVDDDPTEIGRWFDTTVERLEQARAEAARLRAVGNDAAANLVVARALLEFRQFIEDARIPPADCGARPGDDVMAEKRRLIQGTNGAPVASEVGPFGV